MVIGILFLATLIEGLIHYVAGEGDVGRPYLKYVALVIGIAVAVVYKIDIPAMVGLATAWPIANYIVSGIIIGRGSNYTSDIIKSVRK